MFKGFSLWAGVISGGLAQLKDTQSVTTGHMDKKEYAIQTSQNLTGGLGIMAGIEYGAVLGSLFYQVREPSLDLLLEVWWGIELEIMQAIRQGILFLIISL